MVIQILGDIKFQITLDPSTWIFDDRKITLEDALKAEQDDDSITFSDNTEWNRQIIEGSSKPPTLKSEKKYKNSQLLEETFIIRLDTFLEYTEPERGEDAMITYTHDEGTTILPYSERGRHYAQFSQDGKRMYDDNMIDLVVISDNDIETRLQHVTGISIN
ncbi:hypothetical protein [Lacicoccus qingdaonensis]|uniref:Uncharacterized protein n=1 Tax=Lacicoccus qingdaonensis TaxID=576118 RepID=A0A1G9A1A1_9BACL|nr:hypothetical protein [Salinicoccus qingdaonensis]SDK20365.1 hypothetical protein SAMN05216216_10154 [Salinicoccus qingdaonensis]